MSTAYLDRYGRSKSICHRLPPRLKLLLGLAVALAGVSIPIEYWPVHGALACVVFMGHSLARIPLSYLARRLAFFLPMVLLLSISIPLSEAFSAGSASSGGLRIMGAILLRSTLTFLAVLWVVNIMPFDQLLVTLRKLWVPEMIVAMLAFMYRYIFVLWDEYDKMHNARLARSFGAGGRWFRWKTSAQVIGMLLIRSMERAERVHGAMCARGWDGRVRSLDE
jgi:cobalt/nickel transport system permease protein